MSESPTGTARVNPCHRMPKELVQSSLLALYPYMLHPYMLLGELAPTILRELDPRTKSSADFGRYAGTSSITKDARKEINWDRK